MGECVIPMRSRTDAEKGRRAAKSVGIPVFVVSVDPSLTKHGCSVGLRCAARYAGYLTELFARLGISHGEVIGRLI